MEVEDNRRQDPTKEDFNSCPPLPLRRKQLTKIQSLIDDNKPLLLSALNFNANTLDMVERQTL